MIEVFRNLVKNKGLPHDPKCRRIPFSNRKPKTVLFVTSNHDLEKLADGCIHFDIDEEDLPEMHDLDLNDDGVVTHEEFLVAAGHHNPGRHIEANETSRIEKIYNQADLNGDGVVDSEEVRVVLHMHTHVILLGINGHPKDKDSRARH